MCVILFHSKIRGYTNKGMFRYNLLLICMNIYLYSRGNYGVFKVGMTSLDEQAVVLTCTSVNCTGRESYCSTNLGIKCSQSG